MATYCNPRMAKKKAGRGPQPKGLGPTGRGMGNVVPANARGMGNVAPSGSRGLGNAGPLYGKQPKPREI